MMASGAIDLEEIATPKIRDPRQVKGLNSGLCSWNALETFAGFVTAINVPRPQAPHRSRMHLMASSYG
jgi:hypothetical protein